MRYVVLLSGMAGLAASLAAPAAAQIDYAAEERARYEACLDRIVTDPGFGFGKTRAHNMTLLRDLAAFHDLGAPVLLGVSRNRFIVEIGGAPEAKDRLGGSLAVALHAASQGVHILRVHDTEATIQALRLFAALNTDEAENE